jgi:hypothetical protein
MNTDRIRGRRQKSTCKKLIEEAFFLCPSCLPARARERKVLQGKRKISCVNPRIRGANSAISVTARSRPVPPNTSRGGTPTGPRHLLCARSRRGSCLSPETRCVTAAACRRRRAGFLRGERRRVGHRRRGRRGVVVPKQAGQAEAGPRHAGCQLRADADGWNGVASRAMQFRQALCTAPKPERKKKRKETTTTL